MFNKGRRMRKFVSLGIVCLTVLVPSLVVRAQETRKTIQGSVTDPSGAIVVNTTIVAAGETLVAPAKATSDSHAFYRLNALPSTLGGNLINARCICFADEAEGRSVTT